MMDVKLVMASAKRMLNEGPIRAYFDYEAARREHLDEITQSFIELGHELSEVKRLGYLTGESELVSKALLEKARQIASTSPAIEHILSGLINVLESLCRLSFRHFQWLFCG